MKTLADFLKWAKANPDKAMYGTPGAGSMPHLLGALLGLRAGVELKQVPYRGTVPSITDLVGGQIGSAMNPSGDYLQYMKSGRVRVLATSGKKRSPYLPDVPTFTELGFPDVTSEEWFGFYAPAKIPAATLASANAAITAALKDKSVIDAIGVVGLVAHGSTPQEMLADQKAEYERWGRWSSRSVSPRSPDPLRRWRGGHWPGPCQCAGKWAQSHRSGFACSGSGEDCGRFPLMNS